MHRMVWVVAISYTLVQGMEPFNTIRQAMFSNKASQLQEAYLTSIFMASMNAKCVSFALDRILYKESKEKTLLSSLLMVTAFCFYIPLNMMGPLVTSQAFQTSFLKPAKPWSTGLLLRVLTQSLRYAAWFTVTEASLCFLYQHALTRHVSNTINTNIFLNTVNNVIIQPDIVESLDLWALCGMGYFLAQFFHLK